MTNRFVLALLMLSALCTCEKREDQSLLNSQRFLPSAHASDFSVEAKQANSVDVDIYSGPLLTLDAHINLPPAFGTGDANPLIESSMQVDFPAMREGGLSAAFFVVHSAQGTLDPKGYENAHKKAESMFDAIHRVIAESDSQVVLARSSVELREAVAQGKLAIAIGMENAYPIGRDFEYLQKFYDKGLRYLSLTHFDNNHFADSSMSLWRDKRTTNIVNNGISSLGLLLVQKLNKLGVIIDVSLLRSDALRDLVRHSATPVIASHASSRVLNNHPRAMGDREIRAIAERGGVINVVAFDVYLRKVSKEEIDKAVAIKAALGLDKANWYETATQAQVDKLRRQRNALDKQFPRATLATYVDHIDHIVSVAGIDHVGIASEFGGGGGVKGWDYVSETRAVTEELVKRGYSQHEIQKIWGGNVFTRLARSQALCRIE